MTRYVAFLSGYSWAPDKPDVTPFTVSARICANVPTLDTESVRTVYRVMQEQLSSHDTATDFYVAAVRWWNLMDWVAYFRAG